MQPTLSYRTIGSGGSGFPRTRWSLVARVADPSGREEEGSQAWRDALGELVAAYWRPVYRALRVWHHRTRADAEDLTQSFFLELLEKRTLAKFAADPAAGRFRGLLRALLDGFVSGVDKKARRQKRGGDRVHIPLDPAQVEAIEERIAVDPQGDPFDREWWATVIDQALADLANESRSPLARRRLEVFLAYEVEPQGEARPTYADLARRLSLQPHDVKNDLVAARRRFAELILERIREDVRDEAEAREELRALFGGDPP